MLHSSTLPDTGRNVLRWCQGEVVEKCKDRQMPTVCMLWDPMPDIAGSEELSETDVIQPPNKWRKEMEGGWRMSVSFTVEDDLD